MMLGYILVEDIFDEMSQNISYIKLNCYLKEGRKSGSIIFSGCQKISTNFI